MPYYETVFIVRPDLSPAQVDQLTEEVEHIVTHEKGKVLKKENWGLRPFAFPIKKNKRGHYILLNVEASAAAIKELGRKLGLHENILRHLTLSIEAIDQKPSPMMAYKDEPTGGFRPGRGSFRPGGPRRRDDAPREDDMEAPSTTVSAEEGEPK